MTNIRREVERLLDHEPAVRKDLARGIINQRALARQIRGEIGQEASLDAIISAIRRYPLGGRKESDRAEELIRKIKVSTKNKIADIRLKNKSDVHNLIGEITSSVDFGSGETLRIIAALQSVKVILDEKNLDGILEIVPEDVVIDSTKDLSEIILTFPEEAEGTPGIASTITTELALSGINIVEIMSSIPELVLILEEKDLRQTYRILEDLSS